MKYYIEGKKEEISIDQAKMKKTKSRRSLKFKDVKKTSV